MDKFLMCIFLGLVFYKLLLAISLLVFFIIYMVNNSILPEISEKTYWFSSLLFLPAIMFN